MKVPHQPLNPYTPFFTAQGARLGTEILAANAVLLTFLLLISNGLDGFANGAEVLVGEAVGARRQDALATALRVSLVCAAVGAVAFTGLFWSAGREIIGILTDLPEIRTTAGDYLPWLIALPLLAVWSYLLDGVFIGATQVRAMQNTMILATLLFLGIWWKTQPLSNHGLWLALCGFMLARGALLGAVALNLNRRRQWF